MKHAIVNSFLAIENFLNWLPFQYKSYCDNQVKFCILLLKFANSQQLKLCFLL